MLREAVIGMFEAAEPEWVEDARVERPFRVEATNPEDLVVAVLSEALAESDALHEAYDDVIIEHADERGAAGHFIGRAVRRFGTQIKAATYHDLAVEHRDGAWHAVITFDA